MKQIFVVTRQAFSLLTNDLISYPILDQDPICGVFEEFQKAREIVKSSLDYDRNSTQRIKKCTMTSHHSRKDGSTYFMWNEDEKKRMSLLFTIKKYLV